LLFDLWGVIMEGLKCYEGVVDVVNDLSKKKQVFFLSNSPRPLEGMYALLTSWGIETSKDKIVTSGELSRQKIFNHIKNHKEQHNHDILVYHLGGDQNPVMEEALQGHLTKDIDK